MRASAASGPNPPAVVQGRPSWGGRRHRASVPRDRGRSRPRRRAHGLREHLRRDPALQCAVVGAIIKGNYVAISEKIPGLTVKDPHNALAVKRQGWPDLPRLVLLRTRGKVLRRAGPALAVAGTVAAGDRAGARLTRSSKRDTR
jgi:hypothetical protein